ncbi:MAG: hypothetical protein AAGE65_09345, partial [Planctomycetota bacterium]
LTGGDRGPVPHAAWLALAHLDDERVDPHFREVENLDREASVAWQYGLGLRDTIDPASARRVGRYLEQTDYAPARRAAAWVLRRHGGEGILPLMRDRISHDMDPAVVSEAILALGDAHQPEDERLLGDIYMDVHQSRDVAVLKELHQKHRFPIGGRGLHGINTDHGFPIVGIRNAAALALAHYDVDPDQESPALRSLTRPFRRFEGELPDVGIPHENLRGGPPIRVTNGNLAVTPGPYPFLDRAWFDVSGNLRVEGAAEKRFGLIALGKVGFEEEADLLVDVLRRKYIPDVLSKPKHRIDPNRAFAVYALGHYIRRAGERFEREGKPHRAERARRRNGRYVETLRRVVQDTNEPESLRSAAVVALGLSQDPGAANAIREAAASFRSNTLMLGYAALALGLLGDRDALPVARRALKIESREGAAARIDAQMLTARGVRHSLPLKALLTARAACDGVGLVGQTDADAAFLERMVGDNYFVSQSAVLALRRMGAGEPTLRAMIDVLENDPPIPLAALAAWSIGVLLDPDPDPRMLSLTQGHNFTLPNERHFVDEIAPNHFQRIAKEDPGLRYRAYAQPFFNRMLLPGARLR